MSDVPGGQVTVPTDDDLDAAAARWFLTPAERGNPHTQIDRVPIDDGRGWTAGNTVRPLVHGAAYFGRLYEELCTLHSGDRVFFTDWCGDADEKLLPDGATVGEVLCDLAKNDIEVRGLVWRSHSEKMSYNAGENQKLGTEINEAGGEVLLDQRVRRFGSHHQKLFVIQHQGDSGRDVAFVGGIDLCHGRRDDAAHDGDPQQMAMDERYTKLTGRTPWHDVALELRGPVVGDLLRTFIERWDDPTPLDRRTPYRMLMQKKAHMPRRPQKMSEQFPDPEPVGEHAVQVLRTFARKRPHFPFAPHGERSIARAYEKAFRNAENLIYVEDQYFWSHAVAKGIATALRRAPDLRLIAVVPRFPDQDGATSGPPNRLGQIRAMELLKEAAPGRVAFYDVENEAGVPIYVHAKVCIIDDTWMTCGSDNFNRRSWTMDTELTCAVLDPARDPREPRDLSRDGARVLPRSLRLQLWGEHLALDPDEPDLIDPATAFALWNRSAAALDAWHAAGGPDSGRPRPRGRARAHHPDPVGRLQRLWADPYHRIFFDPDDRPRDEARRNTF